MTVCNMSIEGGARAGMIAAGSQDRRLPARTTLPAERRRLRRLAAQWLTYRTDDGASFDRSIAFDAAAFAPQVTWGTNPGMVTEVTGKVPDPSSFDRRHFAPRDRTGARIHGPRARHPITDVKVDRVFIGSCTNSRVSDLQAAADIVKGRRVASTVHAMVVPGSQLVKNEAEKLGLDRVFREAGFEWREAGCSMCLGMNPDILKPGERCASTSNRNFEGRQGKGGRTHLVSPDHGRRRRRRRPFRRHSRMGVS